VDDFLQFTINWSLAEEERYFANPEHLCKQVRKTHGYGVEERLIGEYFQPWGRTQESFDGLVLPNAETLLLLQITLALRHEIKTHGVKGILNALPGTIKRICIIFTVPEDRADNYTTPQTAPDPCDLGPKGTKCTIQQFRLVFNDRAVQSIALRRIGTQEPYLKI